MNLLRILFEDDNIVAIDKPSGFHVHPPEDSRHKIGNQKNCLYLLSRQIETYLYPVHRLDPPTSGVLLYAKTKEAASELSFQFREHQIKKTYLAICRGYCPDGGVIDYEIDTKPSKTKFERIGVCELPITNSKYPTSRYSLVRVMPESGRQHQIRRHFDHMSHPLVGDKVYGKGEHNRIFATQMDKDRLWLHALEIEFTHPLLKTKMLTRSRFRDDWLRSFELFGVCPL